jgi:hypothetical protein
MHRPFADGEGLSHLTIIPVMGCRGKDLDVEGCGRVRAEEGRAADLWVQASLDYKQRLQQLFFPEGIAYDGTRFNRTAVTAPLFSYLSQSEDADERVVSRVGIEPTTRRLRVCCSAN